MASEDELDLNLLTVADTEYLSVFDSAWLSSESPHSVDWLNDKPFSKARAEKLERKFQVRPEVAKLLMQIIKVEESWLPKEDRLANYHDTIIAFLMQAEQYLRVKPLIQGGDYMVARAADMFVNNGLYNVYKLAPSEYRRSVIKRSFLVGVPLLSLLAIAFSANWSLLAGGLAALAVAIILYAFTVVPKRYRALQKLVGYLKEKHDIDIASKEPLKPQEINILAIHLYEWEMYKGDDTQMEKDHKVKISAKLINSFVREYGTSREVAKDILQHYYRRSPWKGEDLDLSQPYYDYIQRFQTTSFREAFSQEYAREKSRSFTNKRRWLWFVVVFEALMLPTGVYIALVDIDHTNDNSHIVFGSVIIIVSSWYLLLYISKLRESYKNNHD